MQSFEESNLKHKDQANELKELFDDINKNQSNRSQKIDDNLPKIDVLNLPPRKEIHNNDNKWLHIPISKPFLRLLLIIVIVIGLIITFIYIDELNIFEFITNDLLGDF